MYTVRDTDVVVTDISPHMMSQITLGTIPGRAPLLLVGPEESKHKKYVVCATRDGKGFVIANNDAPFKVLATKEVSSISTFFFLQNLYFFENNNKAKKNH